MKDLTIDNVRENFSLFTFDSRGNKFYQAGYLDENNEPKTVMIDTATENTQIYKLGNQNPYFSYFELDKNEDMNFGFILKNSNIDWEEEVQWRLCFQEYLQWNHQHRKPQS